MSCNNLIHQRHLCTMFGNYSGTVIGEKKVFAVQRTKRATMQRQPKQTMKYNHITTMEWSYYDMGPSIKYVTLFLANFDSPCHTLSHISDPPIFSRPSTQNPDTSSLYKFSLNCSRGLLSGGFCPGVFCLEGFVQWWFLSVPPSVRIHLLQQKVKNHFKTLTAGVFITSTR